MRSSMLHYSQKFAVKPDPADEKKMKDCCC